MWEYEKCCAWVLQMWNCGRLLSTTADLRGSVARTASRLMPSNNAAAAHGRSCFSPYASWSHLCETCVDDPGIDAVRSDLVKADAERQVPYGEKVAVSQRPTFQVLFDTSPSIAVTSSLKAIMGSQRCIP